MTDVVGVKVSLDAEQIQQQVVTAILESTIGDAVKKGIASIHEKYKEGYEFQRWVDAAIEAEVKKVISGLVVTELRPMIEERVKAAVNEKMVDGVVQAVWDKAMRDY